MTIFSLIRDFVDPPDRGELAPTKSSQFDRPVPNELNRHAIYNDRYQSTWQDRVRVMWLPNDHGTLSPEASLVAECTLFSALAGCLGGIIMNVSEERKSFMTKNRHEIFANPMDAERKLTDKLLLAAYKHGFKWGWRCAVMTLVYTGGGLLFPYPYFVTWI